MVGRSELARTGIRLETGKETDRDECSSCYILGNQEGITPASALADTPRGKP